MDSRKSDSRLLTSDFRPGPFDADRSRGVLPAQPTKLPVRWNSEGNQGFPGYAAQDCQGPSVPDGLYWRRSCRMHAPAKYVEKGLSIAANGIWQVFSTANKISQNPSFIPRWSDKPLLKSYQKTKPPLGWPRETDSLCPDCTREARQAILDGKKDVSVLLNEKVGEIKATILERDGKILMVKDCPIHGHFEDTMAIDPAFFKHLEEAFPTRHPRPQRR